MRITHVITRMVAGGAQRNTLMCCQHQAALGHEVTLISGLETGPEGSLLEEARNSNFRFVEMPALVREISPKRDLLATLQLIQNLRRARPEILHTHTSKAGILGRIAGFVCGTPVVIHTPHGHVFHSYFSRLKTRAFKLCEQILMHCSDGLVMLSGREQRDHLNEGIGPWQKMCVIPSGVPLEGYLQLQRAPRTGGFTIGYVGRLADIKGPLDLVEAMAILAQRHSQSQLLMVGDGPQRAEVEAAIHRHQLQERVRITGWQTEPGAFLESMDLLVVPSHNEGMGRVVVEAMAAGLPVVATAVGGLLDLVVPGYTGELAPPKDPAALAEAIEKVLALPDRGAKLGQNGRAASAGYSDQVMFERLELLYQKLARLKGVGYNGKA